MGQVGFVWFGLEGSKFQHSHLIWSITKVGIELLGQLKNMKHRLPKEHQRLLRKHGYQETMDDLKEAVDQNHGMISKIMADVEEMFENVTHQVKEESDPRVRPSQLDMDNRVFQNAQKSKDLRGWLAKYVVIHN